MVQKRPNRIIANLKSDIDLNSSIGEVVSYNKKRKVKKVQYRRDLSQKSNIKSPILKNMQLTAEGTPWIMDHFSDFFLKD